MNKNVIMPFGKYKGETLGRIMGRDRGTRYLSWV